jgi:hypothetical protein
LKYRNSQTYSRYPFSTYFRCVKRLISAAESREVFYLTSEMWGKFDFTRHISGKRSSHCFILMPLPVSTYIPKGMRAGGHCQRQKRVPDLPGDL